MTTNAASTGAATRERPSNREPNLLPRGAVFAAVLLTAAWLAFVVASSFTIALPALPSFGGHAPASAGGASTDYLYLTIAFNPTSGLDEYFPANFTVPANVPVVIQITNYDDGTNAVPAGYTSVAGTAGGTMTVQYGGTTAAKSTVTSVDAGAIAHTFTIPSMGSGASGTPQKLNVPVPAATAAGPTVVTFTVTFPTAGAIVWLCMAPCDPSSMATPGLMTGTVSVV